MHEREEDVVCLLCHAFSAGSCRLQPVISRPWAMAGARDYGCRYNHGGFSLLSRNNIQSVALNPLDVEVARIEYRLSSHHR